MIFIDVEAVKTYLNVDPYSAATTIAELIQITDAYLLGLSSLAKKMELLNKLFNALKWLKRIC
jgi:hypothetical protein